MSDQPASGSARAPLWRPRPQRRIAFQFLLFSTAVVAIAMILLGSLVSTIVGDGIVNGVGGTAAASLESFIAHEVDLEGNAPLTPAETASIDRLLLIAGEATSTRLVEIHLWRPDGLSIYNGQQAFFDPFSQESFDSALAGDVRSQVVDVRLSAVGPVDDLPLRLLRIYTPIRDESSGDIRAVAAFYFGTRALTAQQNGGQVLVWLTVLCAGILVQVALYVFVSAIDSRLTQQEGRLVETLEATRALADQNNALRETSEKLRLDAIDANETLLARVGADIHDGPLQMLTLIQLRLSRLSDLAMVGSIADLARQTVGELRNLSVGLVLPELEGLSLSATIQLAISRHEATTGTRVTSELLNLDGPVESAIRTSVFRIVQQSLANAAQHAAGKGQNVTAQRGGAGLTVEISSELIAPSDTPQRDGPRLGLRGMKLRAEAIGGRLDTVTTNTHTVVRLFVPPTALR